MVNLKTGRFDNIDLAVQALYFLAYTADDDS